MNIKDYKDGLIVEVKGKSYGKYKTYELEPKGEGARTDGKGTTLINLWGN